jgi:hypothetical protein
MARDDDFEAPLYLALKGTVTLVFARFVTNGFLRSILSVAKQGLYSDGL